MLWLWWYQNFLCVNANLISLTMVTDYVAYVAICGIFSGLYHASDSASLSHSLGNHRPKVFDADVNVPSSCRMGEGYPPMLLPILTSALRLHSCSSVVIVLHFPTLLRLSYAPSIQSFSANRLGAGGLLLGEYPDKRCRYLACGETQENARDATQRRPNDNRRSLRSPS